MADNTPAAMPSAPPQSAASDLLNALRALVIMLPSDDVERDPRERIPACFNYVRWGDVRAARAAIAKAEGRS